MQAIVIRGAKDIALEERPRPEPAAGEVLVRVRTCGICGSDLARALGGKAWRYPIVLGHEFAGEVAALGAGVAGFHEGERVAGVPLIPCFFCPRCAAGRYSLCASYSFVGSRRDGALAEYCAVPARCLVPVGGLELDAAALIEPATVPRHGLDLAGGLPAGADALVLGAGAIGLFAVAWLKRLGAGRIFVSDVGEERLALAAKLGATRLIRAGKEDVVAVLKEETLGQFAGVVIETAGVPATQRQALEAAGPAGVVVAVGTAHQDVVLPAAAWEGIVRRELKVVGSWMSYGAPWPGPAWEASRQALAEGFVEPAAIITRRFRPAEAAPAFAAAADPATAGRVVIDFWAENDLK